MPALLLTFAQQRYNYSAVAVWQNDDKDNVQIKRQFQMQPALIPSTIAPPN
uniref:Uncharacterized protein n=1 Tax=Rheinheimera sp. BAL341 TaxID=1708203 RepID=A0A486XQE2_9GAMM